MDSLQGLPVCAYFVFFGLFWLISDNKMISLDDKIDNSPQNERVVSNKNKKNKGEKNGNESSSDAV